MILCSLLRMYIIMATLCCTGYVVMRVADCLPISKIQVCYQWHVHMDHPPGGTLPFMNMEHYWPAGSRTA